MVKKKTSMKRKKKNNKKLNNKNHNGLKVYKVNGASKKRSQNARKEKTIQSFLIVLIVILAIAAIFSAINTFFPNMFGKYSLSGELAATVNGVPITMQQLDEDYDRLPLEYKYYVTKEAFLEQLINEQLMTEEALKQGLTVSEGEIDERINAFMNDSNMTEEQLAEVIKEKNLDNQGFRDLVRNQLLVDKIIGQAIRDNIDVSTEEVLQYYNDNPQTFEVPEVVTTKHILIRTDDKTEQEAEEIADSVFAELEDDNSNFCDLVTEFSEDPGSIENCGEYTFPRGQMVEEFENRAFDQDVDEVSIVQTSFGYHIIWTTGKNPEQVIPFKDVEEQIRVILEKQQETLLYSEFIEDLTAKAVIVNYLVEAEETSEAEEPEVEAEEAGEIQISIEEPEPTPAAQVTTKATIVASEEEEEEIEVIEVEIIEEQEELEQEVEEMIEEVIEEPVEEPVPVVISQVNFAECLTKNNVVLYGAFWDSSTKTQKSAFGADFAKLNYVECGIEGDYRAQSQKCADAGILAYPTWKIDNEKHMGVMDKTHLSALTGC
ncbi:MAG: peptidylprolyl isomerase, partial [Nanoarchaeota archaeon]|nr:peptidylprolyl isomerase [Nanoarchaeota archaeon]